MLALTDFNKPYLISSLSEPMVAKHHWIFSGQMLDFTLAPIEYLEETSGPAVKVEINGLEFLVPTSWHILITENETYQLDTVPIANCAKIECLAFIMTPDNMKFRTSPVKVLEFIPHAQLVHPMINKGTALQHPVGLICERDNFFQATVSIGPFDLYKYLTEKVVGDLIS